MYALTRINNIYNSVRYYCCCCAAADARATTGSVHAFGSGFTTRPTGEMMRSRVLVRERGKRKTKRIDLRGIKSQLFLESACR